VNFGDILDRWERGQYGKESMSHNGSSGVTRTSQKNVMEIWLGENKVYDKDANARKEPSPGEHRRRLLHIQPDEILDIHGLTSDKAWLSLDLFFTRARSCGFEKLRIIHGKGNNSQGEAVLGHIVRKFIEQCSFAGESGYEKAANGGTGATWVLLKD